MDTIEKLEEIATICEQARTLAEELQKKDIVDILDKAILAACRDAMLALSGEDKPRAQRLVPSS